MEASPTITQPTARREAMVLLTLSAIAILAIAGVFALVKRFHHWQGSLPTL